MYTYEINSISAFPKAKNATFVFADVSDLSKLSVSPNITMQLSTFDEDMPIIVVVPDDSLVTIYDHALAPNTYIYSLKGNKLSNWQKLFTCLIETPIYETALFVEWNVLLHVAESDMLFNMNRNPNYEWMAETLDFDYSDWYERMLTTMKDSNLASIGVDRRHATDIVSLMNDCPDYNYPIQLVLYDFGALRKLKVSKNPAMNATNPIIRDTLIDLAIRDAGGNTNTVPLFCINTPSVVYTEEDLHLLLSLPKKYPALFRRLRSADLRTLQH